MPRDDILVKQPTSVATPPNSTFTLPFSTPFTFPEIIDADHFTINGLARRIRSSSTPAIELRSLIFEVCWRLIRHDLSEDLVMRPAFANVLGKPGAEMAEHDRRDHMRGREILLKLVNSEPDFEDPAAMRRVLGMVGDLFDELGEHMAIESGEHIPKFCTVIDQETSQRLARDYAMTLCMTPYITTFNVDADPRMLTPVLMFPGGVKTYVNTDLTVLRRIYNEVIKDAKHDNGKRIKEEIEKEIERLKVGKWLGYNERKALREGKGGGMGKL